LGFYAGGGKLSRRRAIWAGIFLLAVLAAGACAAVATRPASRPATRYIGSRNGYAYHRPTCRHVKRIYLENRIVWSHHEDALDSGFRPCKHCKPPGRDAEDERRIPPHGPEIRSHAPEFGSYPTNSYVLKKGA